MVKIGSVGTVSTSYGCFSPLVMPSLRIVGSFIKPVKWYRRIGLETSMLA